MKRTLRESLLDYDLVLLRSLAEVRGAALTSTHRLTVVDELAQELLAPTSVAIATSDLSPAESKAMTTLQRSGGWMESPRFARRYGTVRVMGPGRLERDKPWLSPANPAEGLWYRALIFKGFRQTEAGVVEVVYIPQDVLALLPIFPSDKSPAPEEKVEISLKPVTPPSHIRPATVDAVEDVFSLLVMVRNHNVRLKADGSLSPKELQAINTLCVSPLPAALVADDVRLALLVHLARAAGLITTNESRLVLYPKPARAWLQTSLAHRTLALQTVWRDDPDWNDVWHVPTLKAQPTGWKNDPILARRKILSFLAVCRPDRWYGLDELTTAVKTFDPDFQRPDGDYTSWYIRDLKGQPLMGFEHWDDVEGALLGFLVSGPLHWLGVVDLGFEGDHGQPVSFRLAATGLALLGLVSLPPAEPSENPPTSPPLSIRNDFIVCVPMAASLLTRFQLARFADFQGRAADQVRYRLSPASMARARRQGINPGQVSAFLARASRDRVPAQVLDGLRGWYERSGSVWLEQGVVLRVDHPEALQALRRDLSIAPLLGETLGSQAVLVPTSNVEQVRRRLIEEGYLEVRGER